MIKKFRLPLLIITGLVIGVLFLIFNNKNNTFRNKNNNFAVGDTASITKIFLTDKFNQSVTLTRRIDNNWTVNDSFVASKPIIDIMLFTIKSVDVKSPVVKSARNTVISNLSSSSVKTDIYQTVYRINLFDVIKLFPHEKLIRTYYVGDATMNNLGTFMLMEGSEEPYVVHIPGFKGFLNSRYSTVVDDWRSHSLFALSLPEIKSVKVTYPDKPEQSFEIKYGDRKFSLISTFNNQEVPNYDTLRVMRFMSSFRNLNFENIVTKMPPHTRDSIIQSTPIFDLVVTSQLNTTYELKTWRRKSDPGQINMEGEETEWDIDRMYGVFQNNKEMLTVQYIMLESIMVPIQSFVKNNEKQ